MYHNPDSRMYIAKLIINDRLFSSSGWMEKVSAPFRQRPGMWERPKMGCFMAKEFYTFQTGVNMRPPGKMAKLNRWGVVCVCVSLHACKNICIYIHDCVFHIGSSWNYIWSLLTITHRYCRSYWVSLLFPSTKLRPPLLWYSLSRPFATTSTTPIIIIIAVAVHLTR